MRRLMDDRAAPPPPVATAPQGAIAPSLGLALACLLHALVFAAVSVAAPMASASWFGVSTGLLALLHAAVAVLALSRRDHALARVWVALAICSLAWLFAVSWVAGSAALYLSALYEGIGRAVAVALACVWAVVVLFTLPISLWGLARVRPRWLGRRAAVAASALIALATIAAFSLRTVARAEPVPAARAEQLAPRLARAAIPHGGPQPGSTLLQLAPISCEQPVDVRRLTLLIGALDRERRPFGACLQAQDGAEIEARLLALLTDRAHPESPVKLDLVRAVQRIPRLHGLLDALSLRPALDGVCTERRCFAPWQLVALDAFTRYRPLEAVRDASFGVALEELGRSLGAADSSTPLYRVESASWIAHGDALTPLVRLRPERTPSDPSAIERAVAGAAGHIVAAQSLDGAFRYLLEPFSGRVDERRVNLPRQAGTVYALCELVPGEHTRATAARALSQLASFERRSGALSALSDQAHVAELGPSALPLIAFLTCRALIGERHDALIGRLARFVLAMQREDGSFFPEFSLSNATPSGAYEPLYAAGQAVLGLVLTEQLARAQPKPDYPAASVLAAAIDRAMAHYGRAYWPKPLRSLFYLEENWHCLAARAALASHRHDDYERFCLDYVRFKRRLILDRGEVVEEFAGGYGLGNMFPPHSTATAGFGEALAAALTVARARGEDTREQAAVLRNVLGFLLRQQWTSANCFACAPGKAAVGGFSESSASPVIRIDYVQHAMAALGHGARALAAR